MEEIFRNPVEIDGLYYYVFPENTTLYRGDNSIYRDRSEGKTPRFPENKPLYLGVTEEDVDQYGIVFRIKTKRPYKLVALDHPATMKALYDDESTPKEIKKILKRNYGYESHSRNSDVKADNQLMAYLCKEGYDGYATNVMDTDLGGKFHREVALCHPQTLEIGEQVTLENDTENKLEESKLRRFGKQQEEARQQKRKMRKLTQLEGSPSFGMNLFTEDNGSPSGSERVFTEASYHSPTASSSSAKRLVYSTPGGGKRKTMRKRKNARKTMRKCKNK